MPTPRPALRPWWLALFAFVLVAMAPAQTSERVRLTSPTAPALADQLEAQGYDVLKGSVSPDSLDLVVSPTERAWLLGAGHALTTIDFGMPLGQRPFAEVPPAGYPDLATIESTMAAAAASHPTLCEMVDLSAAFGAPSTFEGRTIKALRISDNVQTDEDEPRVLFASTHHARETVTPVIALEIIDRLLIGYGNDPAITSAVDDHEIWIVPVVNPDGYDYVFTTDDMWRKNRNPGLTSVGVDLNRNYPMGWSGPCAGSTAEGSQTYKGPAPASEPEVQAIMALSLDRHFSKVIDFHSSGRETLWAYRCTPHPFSSFLETEAQALSVAAGWGSTSRIPSAEGEHQIWQLTRGAHAFLMETHTSFQPAYSSAQTEAAAVWASVLTMFARPVSVTGHLTSASGGLPLAGQIDVLELPFPNGEPGFLAEPDFGRFDLVLPAGTYTLTFNAPGHLPSTQVVTVGPATSTPLNVVLSAAPMDIGQANTATASFELAGAINAFGLAAANGLNGPYFATQAAGDSVVMTLGGPALQPFVLFAGMLNRNNATFAGVGSLDLGMSGASGSFSDLAVVLNGVAPATFLDGLARLDGSGTQSFSFTMPSGAPGPLFSLQAVVYQAAGLPRLTAATELARP
ncbi:MAG: hypothetical protein KDB53_20770 [Planctomycetes bacterium]|nr:hypothetical protein [Planctomycetota bacterium]